MPIDPIGLSLGLASLASLFTTTLDVLEHISSAKSYGSDYELFVTKVETELVRLRLWGEAVNIGGEPHERLQNPEVERAVSKLLQQAICYFQDSEVVTVRYGGRGVGGPARRLIGISGAGLLSSDLETSLGFTNTTAIDHPRGRAEKSQKHASTLRKVRWVLSGKAKSEKLAEKLGWFVDKLYALVPISGVQVHQQPYQQPQQATTSPEIEEISDVLVLQQPVVDDIVHLSIVSSSGRGRMQRRRIESRIRRKSVKHVRSGERPMQSEKFGPMRGSNCSAKQHIFGGVPNLVAPSVHWFFFFKN
ncbi:prion-inhibition and propagation-domain-containing protein [Trichophaea hybrida]|nr:prion-inhibition and propagation-domain-containing protein [Trichophaea hybrida]